ncbi:MAG: integrase core domain-containing protein [Burkholderiaceae bacterium]|nr:integrase core domain-containing protein [Burkholderiaceae bacterium]
MNAHAERFNGTIQEAFAAYHEDLLFTDINAFNDKRLDCLVWFNTEHPHYALGLQPPCEFLKKHYQCNVYRQKTNILVQYKNMSRQS